MQPIYKILFPVGLSIGLLLIGGCQPNLHSRSEALGPLDKSGESGKPVSDSNSSPMPIEGQSIDLFDGETLAGWEITNFGGEGECHASAGELTIEMGYPLSGLNCVRGDLPKRDFEISLEAKRVQGNDFFCGLTFPVNDSHCTFIVGGWAGTVVGLSCIDGKDAARNETRSVMKFERDRWYEIKVRLANDKISCWIDEKKVVDISTVEREFSVRAETLLTRPLGICTFETTAAFRNIKIVKLRSNTKK